MIFPDLVLGSASLKRICFGLANLPICWAVHSRSSAASSSVGSWPWMGVTNATTACPVSSSGTPITAASATASWRTSMDSSSAVDMRWPLTFITSSTLPRTQKYPSLSLRAASPTK